MAPLLRASLVGALLGAAWGAVARGFMRLLTTQPEFSWEGTFFILGIFCVAGALVGLLHGARTSGRSGWWRLVGLPAVLVFFGQGLVLLPGAVGFACVLRGGRLLRMAGAVLVAVPPVLVVALADDASFLTITPAQLVGLGLMTVSAAPLGWGLAELVRRWRPPGASPGSPDGDAGPGVRERSAAGAPV